MILDFGGSQEFREIFDDELQGFLILKMYINLSE